MIRQKTDLNSTKEEERENAINTMTNDIAASTLAPNYAPANYRSAEQVFGGNYPIHTPAGTTSSSIYKIIQ